MKKPSTKFGAKQGANPKPATGIADAGAPFDPARLAEEPSGPAESKVRPAPAPGVPLSEAQYEKLKREAETAGKLPSNRGQEDPAAKK